MSVESRITLHVLLKSRKSLYCLKIFRTERLIDAHNSIVVLSDSQPISEGVGIPFRKVHIVTKMVTFLNPFLLTPITNESSEPTLMTKLLSSIIPLHLPHTRSTLMFNFV